MSSRQRVGLWARPVQTAPPVKRYIGGSGGIVVSRSREEIRAISGEARDRDHAVNSRITQDKASLGNRWGNRNGHWGESHKKILRPWDGRSLLQVLWSEDAWGAAGNCVVGLDCRWRMDVTVFVGRGSSGANTELVQCVDRRWWMRNVCQGRSFFLSHFDDALYSRIRRSWELYCTTNRPLSLIGCRLFSVMCFWPSARRPRLQGVFLEWCRSLPEATQAQEAEDIANNRRRYRLEAVRRRTRLAFQISVPGADCADWHELF